MSDTEEGDGPHTLLLSLEYNCKLIDVNFEYFLPKENV